MLGAALSACSTHTLCVLFPPPHQKKPTDTTLLFGVDLGKGKQEEA